VNSDTAFLKENGSIFVSKGPESKKRKYLNISTMPILTWERIRDLDPGTQWMRILNPDINIESLR